VFICVYLWPIPHFFRPWLSGPRHQRHSPPVRNRCSPFLRDLAAVLTKQLLGIDAIPRKGPAAEMVDEQIVSHGQLESGPPRSDSQIIAVEQPQSEPLVEPADGPIYGPLHEEELVSVRFFK
jgi:hypothetical protein